MFTFLFQSINKFFEWNHFSKKSQDFMRPNLQSTLHNNEAWVWWCKVQGPWLTGYRINRLILTLRRFYSKAGICYRMGSSKAAPSQHHAGSTFSLQKSYIVVPTTLWSTRKQFFFSFSFEFFLFFIPLDEGGGPHVGDLEAPVDSYLPSSRCS